MKTVIRSFAILLFFSQITVAQVAINADNSAPVSSAMLDVKSTNKGLLPPRMTFVQRNNIVSPTEGLMVFCIDCNTDGSGLISVYQGGKWRTLSLDCLIPDSPAAGNHVQTNGQITWNWNAVPIASGYKWNTSDDYATATDLGTVTNRTETGLTTGNTYLRYIWAYNACGISGVTILAGQALSCGSSFTRSHTAGPVAPVTKAVTYGTVTNIPGQELKCWITRNLGATQQANTVDEGTEASAGWYWQFNRKQGYKHDGTTLTPAWIVTAISEDFDWIIENDPCNLLLGSSWRIPTYSDWLSLYIIGGWNNWNGPWSSGLQMHAAGRLNPSNGSLSYRGEQGYYWSTIRKDATNSWYFFLSNTSTFLHYFPKAHGFPLRCVRN